MLPHSRCRPRCFPIHPVECLPSFPAPHVVKSPSASRSSLVSCFTCSVARVAPASGFSLLLLFLRAKLVPTDEPEHCPQESALPSRHKLSLLPIVLLTCTVVRGVMLLRRVTVKHRWLHDRAQQACAIFGEIEKTGTDRTELTHQRSLEEKPVNLWLSCLLGLASARRHRQIDRPWISAVSKESVKPRRWCFHTSQKLGEELLRSRRFLLQLQQTVLSFHAGHFTPPQKPSLDVHDDFFCIFLGLSGHHLPIIVLALIEGSASGNCHDFKASKGTPFAPLLLPSARATPPRNAPPFISVSVHTPSTTSSPLLPALSLLVYRPLITSSALHSRAERRRAAIRIPRSSSQMP